MTRYTRTAFTLIELLVVITIIVVLLALLTPALDKAIYQAELAADGARLKSLGTGALQYATASARRYPYRSVIKRNAGQPSRLVSAWPAGYFDDRGMLAGYISPENLLCPLSRGFDVAATDPAASDNVFAGYSIWFGFRHAGGRSTPMDRIGQKYTWQSAVDDPGAVYSFSLLASDLDHIRFNNGLTFTSHPDDAGLLTETVMEGAEYVPGGLTGRQYSSWWQRVSTAPQRRGKVDLHYAYEDGSVRRLERVEWNEWEDRERMVRVPESSKLNSEAPDWHQLPRH